MSGGYRCQWCDYRAVVPSLLRDHETKCPNRPKESA
jgi:hypothetical protein